MPLPFLQRALLKPWYAMLALLCDKFRSSLKTDKTFAPGLYSSPTTSSTPAWNLSDTSPTMSPRQARGRFSILVSLKAADIPYVVWGLDALACNSVPTLPRDPLEVLVPQKYLARAAAAISNDRSSFYQRIAPFDREDDYIFANQNFSTLVRCNLLICEYLQATKLQSGFEPWQILLIPDHIFNYDTCLNVAFPTVDDIQMPPGCFALEEHDKLKDIHVPGFWGMLNALLSARPMYDSGSVDKQVVAELEEQALLLITWRIRRDGAAEKYMGDSEDYLPADLFEIRNGLRAWNREFFDHHFLD
ncbi:hypothetical protein Dda_4996 [Drechslerella dactyloides]|uniref:Uncharacterized protein n=1 Tax=Drechslerella dactyloides TaxID=74499 RepID=A0AAD6NJR8_DREDA|nr:hypothetical protein Dda_4996 [Drechslerella dactyloides]